MKTFIYYCVRRGILLFLTGFFLLSIATAQVTEKKLQLSGGQPGDTFGISVSLSGDRALIGAVNGGTVRGSVYIFEHQSDGSWVETSRLIPSTGNDFDVFGIDLSLDQDRAIIGAERDDDKGVFSGAAYLFERQEDGTWKEITKLTGSDTAVSDNFGSSVSISGDRVLIGATRNGEPGNFSGSAYIFERHIDGTWLEVAKLNAATRAPADFFGFSVSLYQDYALVSARWSDNHGGNSGSASVFERQSDGTWVEVAELVSSDRVDGDEFGWSVSTKANRALVGAWTKDAWRGAAYLFERQSSGTWTEISKIESSDGAADDTFSTKVSLDSGSALIGSPGSNEARGSAYLLENLDVFDILGRRLAVLQSGLLSGRQRHEFVLDATTLPGG